MAFLRRAFLAAFAGYITMGPIPARAADFAKQLQHDGACLVLARSSTGDVYLRCEGKKGILKTTVEVPVLSSLIQESSPSAYVKALQDAAEARAVWDIVDFAFRHQVRILIRFNESKTLIESAVAYTQQGFEEGVGFRKETPK